MEGEAAEARPTGRQYREYTSREEQGIPDASPREARMRNPEAPVDAAAVPSSAAETPPSFTYETPRYWTEAAVKLNYHPRDGGANNGWWLGAADDGRYDRLRRIALERRQRRRAGLPSAPAQRQAQGGVRRPHTRGVVQGSYRLQGGMGGAGAGGALAATRQRRRQDDRRPATGNMAARGRATGKHRDMQRLRVVGADNGWKRPSTSTGLGVGPTPMRVTAAAVGSARNVTSSSAAQRRPGTTGGKALPRDRVAADVAAREGKAGGAQPSHVQHRGPRPASRLRSPPQRTPVDHPEDSGDVEEPSLALPAFHAIRSQYFMTAGGHDTYGTSAGMMSPIRVAAGGAPRSGAVPFSGSAGAPPVRGSLPSASRQERRPRTAVATPSTRRTPTSPVMGSPAPSSRQSTPFSTVRIGTSLNMPSFYLQKTKPGADTSVLYTALFPNLPVEHVDHSMTLKREYGELYTNKLQKRAQLSPEEFHRERARLAQMSTAAQQEERVPRHRRILLDFETVDYQRSTDLNHPDPFRDPLGVYVPDVPRTHRKGQGEISAYLNKAIMGAVNLKATSHIDC